MLLKIQWKMFSLCLLTKEKQTIGKFYIQSYFEFVSTDSPWLYLMHLLYMPQLIFEQNSPREKSSICRLLPNTFQVFKVFLVYFWSLKLGLDPANHIFTWKTAARNLKSSIELNKVITTRNFCGKKTSRHLWMFMKKIVNLNLNLNEVYSHGI